jgi:hypothetical protein
MRVDLLLLACCIAQVSGLDALIRPVVDVSPDLEPLLKRGHLAVSQRNVIQALMLRVTYVLVRLEFLFAVHLFY